MLWDANDWSHRISHIKFLATYPKLFIMFYLPSSRLCRLRPMTRFEQHLKAQDFQVCVTIIEARQLPGLNMVWASDSHLLWKWTFEMGKTDKNEKFRSFFIAFFSGSSCLHSNRRSKEIHERQRKHQLSVLQWGMYRALTITIYFCACTFARISHASSLSCYKLSEPESLLFDLEQNWKIFS